MQSVEYSQWLPFDVHVIFDYLTDPQALAAVVGRIVSAKVIERQTDRGKLVVVLDLPTHRNVETHGDVTGVPYEHLSFRTVEPFPLEFTWTFTPCERDGQAGTEIQSTLGFDLSTFGLPVLGMMVKSVIAAELKEDMGRLQEQLAQKT